MNEAILLAELARSESTQHLILVPTGSHQYQVQGDCDRMHSTWQSAVIKSSTQNQSKGLLLECKA